MGLSSVLVVASSAYVDQSKSAPLGAATLVFNVILASIILGERFLVIHAISVLLVVAGTAVTVAAAPASGRVFTLDEMLDHNDAMAVAYSVVFGTTFVTGAVTLERATWRGCVVPPASRFRLAAIAACLGGAANGYVALGTKVLSSAVVDGDWAAFARAPLWAYAILGNAALVAQVWYLNAALRLASALQAVPIFQAAIIVSGSLVGIVYFHDMRGAPGALGTFFAGCAVLCSGVLVLGAQPPPAPAQADSAALGDSLLEQPPLPLLTEKHAAADSSAPPSSDEAPGARLLGEGDGAELNAARRVSAVRSKGGAPSGGGSGGAAEEEARTAVRWWEREALPEARRVAVELVNRVRRVFAR